MVVGTRYAINSFRQAQDFIGGGFDYAKWESLRDSDRRRAIREVKKLISRYKLFKFFASCNFVSIDNYIDLLAVKSVISVFKANNFKFDENHDDNFYWC